MAEPRTVLLGLRSNVHFFASHQGFAKLDARVKALSLLYDHVVLEDGVYEGSVGEAGSDGWVMPLMSEEQLRPLRTRRGERFAVRAWLEGSDTKSTVFDTTLVRSFRAQFISIADQAASADPDWLSLEGFDSLDSDVREADRLRGSWEWEDREILDELLVDLPRFLKGAIVRHLYTDLARAYVLGIDASPDGEHSRLLNMKVSDQSIAAMSGGRTLRLAVPDIRNATWEDVAELRKDPGLKNLRAKLQEIDVAGLTDEEVIRTLEREHAEELRRRMPRWRGFAVKVGWNLLSFVPLVGPPSSAFQTAGSLASTVRARRHWTATLMRIRRRAEARREDAAG
jgi:hypothetical protein